MYLRGFIPWIVFAAVSSAGWQWGALSAAACGLWLLVQDRKAGVPGAALVLQFSTLGYFAALTAFALADPHSPVRHYVGALSLGWLAATAWATVAVGNPFTVGIARQSVPEELWYNPRFLRMNTIITSVWAASFTLTSAAVVVCVVSGAGTVASLACQVLGFLAPATFTKQYPKAVQARPAAAAGPAR